MHKAIIHTDGGARGNPGPAGIGVVIKVGDHVVEHKRCIGEATNNVAEYTAVLDALDQVSLVLPQIDHLAFYLDSQLVERQIAGFYKIKEPALQILHKKVLQKLAEINIPYTFTHIPRAQNAKADALVNQALDAL